jgi:hypothetical protein
MKTFRTGLILGTMALALAGCGVFGGGGSKRPKTPTIGQRVPILTSESNAEVDPALTDVAILLPPAEVNTEWTQPGGNGPKMMGHVGLGTSIGVAWTAKIEGTSKSARLAASPIVAEGKIFVVDVRAKLYAFDANSGATLWVRQIGDASSDDLSKDKGSLFGGGVSYDDGKLFATSGLGDVAAFNAADGKQIWKVRPGGPLRGAPSISNGQVYVMSQDNQILRSDKQMVIRSGMKQPHWKFRAFLALVPRPSRREALWQASPRANSTPIAMKTDDRSGLTRCRARAFRRPWPAFPMSMQARSLIAAAFLPSGKADAWSAWNS